MSTDNPFKSALRASRRQIGFWLSLGDAYAAEVCATAGFDWLVIDGEHTPNDVRSILAQLQAVAAYPSHAVVRPPIGETYRIKQLLDIGARTLLIPMVDTPEQARALVAATRYPPQGIRGVGSRMARASRFNAQPDYLAHANDGVCLLVQVETAEGLNNLDAIAATEGVDGVFIGPSDLSAALGHLGDSAHPEVQAAIKHAFDRIRAAGKPAGVMSLNAAECDRYLEWGATFVAVGGDVAMLSDGARALAKRFAAGT
jgi:4-hydroxy-2-oxoheptanedioate aldolase